MAFLNPLWEFPAWYAKLGRISFLSHSLRLFMYHYPNIQRYVA
jgi:hypothetical protein